MGKRIGFRILPFLIMGLILVCVSSCKKEDNNLSSGNSTNGKTSALFNPSVTYGTMTDQDGNLYKTVTIGTQMWMAENLRTTKYNDGTAIQIVIKSNDWAELTTGAYCNYNNTISPDTIATFGRLYNWYAINTGKLAPKGWHVSTDAEWTTLTDYLGGEFVSGSKLKEVGTIHWISPNTGATNETGFTALSGGYRYFDGTFTNFGYYGGWWTATEYYTGSVWFRLMYYGISPVSRDYGVTKMGFSVRCVRD